MGKEVMAQSTSQFPATIVGSRSFTTT